MTGGAAVSLLGRDLLKEIDLSRADFIHLIELAARLKSERRTGPEYLAGRRIALLFEKTSTRTRVAFELGAAELGATTTYLDPASSQMGHKESVADTARFLGRMFDAIEFRGTSQQTVETLAEFAEVPVYNGLTDEWHPTQMLADVLTMCETTGKDYADLSYAYIGDARNNMGNSLLVTGAILGADVRIIAPRALWPREDVQALAAERASSSGAQLTLTDDPVAGLAGVDAVHTDVWVSMGEPAEVWQQRIDLLTPYRVDAATMALTGRPDSTFMHCLPAFHDQKTTIGREVAGQFGLTDGIEVSNEVFESPTSVVFQQAENRLHTIKALMVATLSDAY